MLKTSTTDALETTSKTSVQEPAEVTCDLIGNKITDKITQISQNSPQNSSDTVKNETPNIGFDWKIKGKICILKKHNKLFDKMGLIW